MGRQGRRENCRNYCWCMKRAEQLADIRSIMRVIPRDTANEAMLG
jgi:hypothetical protein